MTPKLLTIVLDGWGLNKDYEGNAIARAKTPTFDRLMKNYPVAILEASGESVGLPDGQMGTSEVNHFTLGAGRVVYQDLVRINKAIDDGSYHKNETFRAAFEHTKKYHSHLHYIGLLSDGGVHSQQHHLFELLKTAKLHGVSKVYLHLFTDGRDTSPHGGVRYLADLNAKIAEYGVGTIKSLVGRYFAMDRDHNWDRTDKAFHLLTQGKGKTYNTASEALEASYKAEVTDEFVEPSWIGSSSGMISDNDAVIFFNYRNDRPRQLTERLLEKGPKNLFLATMTEYNPHYHLPVAFPPTDTSNPMGEIIQNASLKQLRITETEKFAHMTFFLNCKQEEAFEGEDRFMFDSYSDIKTHDERPQMRAPDIASQIIQDLNSGIHQAVFANICNGDMIGHTGNIPAAIKACETVDQALTDILPVAHKHGYSVIVTADHGNCDEMIDEKSGEILTNHSLNPVPFILVDQKIKELNRKEGNLTDVTATILKLLHLKPAQPMTGESFI